MPCLLTHTHSPVYPLTHTLPTANTGEYEKAATLYMKGGKVSKAVEMCFNANLFDVLQHITDDLKEDADPALFLRYVLS